MSVYTGEVSCANALAFTHAIHIPFVNKPIVLKMLSIIKHTLIACSNKDQTCNTLRLNGHLSLLSPGNSEEREKLLTSTTSVNCT